MSDVKGLAFALLAIALGASTAGAQEMPKYDVDAYCASLAKFGGGHSEMMKDGCFQLEQSSYDNLKETWPSLAPAMKRECMKIASFGSPGSYMMLQGCVEMEQASKVKNDNRKFKF